MGVTIPTIKVSARSGLPLIALCCIAVSAAWGHGVHGEHAKILAFEGPLSYFWVGAVHMLTGYDHLLFLFGVMFFLTSFTTIVAGITAFTVGHSITLIGATLLGLKANYFLIDAVTAISVIDKGFENLDGFRHWFGMNAPNMLGMIVAFGLIHGFGLATRLQDFGLPRNGLVPRLLAFNAGIEVGQIGALVVMAGILAIFRRSQAFAPFTMIANTALMVVGGLLFLHQVHGDQHNAYPNEFGFGTTSHILDHFKNDIPGSGTEKPLDMAPDGAERAK